MKKEVRDDTRLGWAQGDRESPKTSRPPESVRKAPHGRPEGEENAFWKPVSSYKSNHAGTRSGHIAKQSC